MVDALRGHPAWAAVAFGFAAGASAGDGWPRRSPAYAEEAMSAEAPDPAVPREADPELGVPHDAGVEDAGAPPVVPRSIVALRRTRRVLWIAVAVALPVTMLILVLATRPSAESRSVRSPLVGRPAPAAEGATVDGGRASLADLRGRWVVVNFFATWCIPCRTEHPELVRFSEAHKATGDARVLAVVYSDSSPAVREYRAANGGDWPMLTDPDGRIALDFGVAGVPESFLVSPDGIIVSKILGGVRAADLDRLLERARAQG